MAAATTVDPYFMDYFRHLLTKDGAPRAPNGEHVSLYGNCGEEVQDHFTSMRGVDQDLFSRFIVNRCMNPFNNYIIEPSRLLWNGVFKHGRQIPPKEVLAHSTVQSIAKVLKVMLATVSLAGAIVTLYSIETMKYRLVTMTLFGLLFSLEVVLLGSSSMGLFTLNAT
jgi:hypothetical protein